MKIVIDAFGGDNAPIEIIEGVLLGLKKHEDLEIVLGGQEAKIPRPADSGAYGRLNDPNKLTRLSLYRNS